LDQKMLTYILKEFDKIITVEENSLLGGFGSAILEFAEASDLDRSSIKRMGIPDEFIQHGSRNQLLGLLGLDKNGIIQTVKRILESKTASGKVRMHKTKT